MTRHEPAFNGKLMNHLVGGRAQINRPPIQIQQHGFTRDFTLETNKCRSRLGTAHGADRLTAQLDPDSRTAGRPIQLLAETMQFVSPGGELFPGALFLIGASRVECNHRAPRGMKITSRRGKRVGSFRVKKGQKILLVGEPGRNQAMAWCHELDSLGCEVQMKPDNHTL